MQLSDKTDEEILAVAEPIWANLMEGSKEIDHAKHVRDFTQRMKDAVTAERLHEMCTEYQERIGFFTHWEFVAIFRRKTSVAIVWKQFAEKTDDEYLAEMVLVERDGRYMVDHAIII